MAASTPAREATKQIISYRSVYGMDNNIHIQNLEYVRIAVQYNTRSY